MSRVEDNENESLENSLNLSTKRFGPNDYSEGGSKVVLLLKPAGGAPMLKRERWALPNSSTVSDIVMFLKDHMKLDPQQQLFLYVKQSFAPSLDSTIGLVSNCFGSDGMLVLHYALTQAWG
ncbi:unnamed protein product [Adineta steineri]|uniref:Ubiquitin-like protein ATG12 n=2 Tax=Adineta steineri TaxID=433720 RepID=A0A814NE56_9BILA|nr:unnamed protein product [Adineta steineri]CAF1493800.1 unnamed protein product [Adineta steineri]CAF1502068.1 unnamed protein product [Adineta steineri]CAF1642255.1 unnamed protein product [Adineta steineri]CAF3950786.1 unnamed protein product [Adineta steineri]